MKHRVTLMGQTETIGTGGRKTTSWPVIATVSADVMPRRSDVTVIADKLTFPVHYRVTVPYAASYLGARRIDWGARTFLVRSAVNTGEDNKLILFETEENTA